MNAVSATALFHFIREGWMKNKRERLYMRFNVNKKWNNHLECHQPSIQSPRRLSTL